MLSKQIDDLEPTLTRHGYDVRDLAEQFNAKPAEIKLLFRGQLDPARARELHRSDASSRATPLGAKPLLTGASIDSCN